jgi:hypothetical protein
MATTKVTKVARRISVTGAFVIPRVSFVVAFDFSRKQLKRDAAKASLEMNGFCAKPLPAPVGER